jgi:hypothetical protein
MFYVLLMIAAALKGRMMKNYITDAEKENN